MSDWRSLPVLRNDSLIWEDTASLPVPGRIVPCLLCTKPFIMRQYVGAPDQICGECWKTYKDAARLVCWKCRVTICRLVPKLLDNGFYVRPSTVYHSSACNICQPGLKQSDIIEISTWEQHVKPKKLILPGTKYGPVH